MKPSDLMNSDDGELREEQQAAFDLQCFREFANSFGLHPAWAKSFGDRDDGLTPWQRLESELGHRLPYFIGGRRVRKFNLLNLVLGRKLSKDPLLDAFEDLIEISDGRPVAMIFKFAGDKQRAIPGTKMVVTQGVPWNLSGIVLVKPAGPVWVGTYAAWRDRLADEHTLGFEA